MQRPELEPVDYNQTHLINQTNLFIANSIFKDSGVKLNEGGVCGGLSSRYLLYKARGKEHAFFAKLKKISQLSIHDYEKDKDIVLGLIGEVCPLQNPNTYIKSSVNQGDLDIIFSQKDQANIERRFSLGIRWKLDELDNLFQDTIKEDEMVYMAANQHAVAAFKKFNTYYLYDPNSKDGERKFSSLGEFTEYAKTCLFVKPTDSSIDIRIKTFKYKKKNNLTPPSVYPSKAVLASRVSTQLDPDFFHSMEVAAIINDVEMGQELIKRGANPFQSNPNSLQPHASILLIACRYGAKDFVKMILDRPVTVPAAILEACLSDILSRGNAAISDLLVDYYDQRYPGYIKMHLPHFYKQACLGGNINTIKRIENIDKQQLTSIAIQQSTFLIAMKYGYTELLDKLLTEFPQLKNNAAMVDEGLESAIKAGQFSVIARLSNTLGMVPSRYLHSAIVNNQSKIATQILSTGTPSTFALVYLAIEHNQLQSVKSLLQAKANQHPKDAKLFEALTEAMKGNVEACNFLINTAENKKFAENFLTFAIVHNERPLIAALKKLKISINKSNPIAGKQLALACARGDLKTAQHLLEEGVDPQQTLDVTEKAKTITKDLLTLATDKSNPKLVKLLLHYNKNISSAKINEILFYACYWGNIDLVKEIGKLPGFSLQQLGFNPLETAATFKNYGVVNCLLETHYDPMNREFILNLCKAEKLEILKPLILKHPELKDLFNHIEVITLLESAIELNAGKGVECLLLLKKLSGEEKTQLLTQACNQGKHNSVNSFLKHNALFKSNYREAVMHGPTYRRLLHLAFGLDINQGRLEDKVLLQHAVLYDHPDIYKFLIEKNPELEKEINNHPLSAISSLPKLLNPEMQKYVRARKEVIDDIKHGRHHLFNYNKSDTLFTACRQGKVAAVKHLVEKNKVDLGAYQDLDILLEIAANRYHLAIVSYLVPLISNEKLNQCLKTFIQSESFIPVVAILEVIKDYDLKPEVKALIVAKQFQIRDIFRTDIAREDLPVDEALARQERVTHEKNALGVILHLPSSPTQSAKR